MIPPPQIKTHLNHPHVVLKIILRWIINVRAKAKIMKLVEENIFIFEIADRTKKALIIKSFLGFTKIKNFCSL
jgi:hypothetical protein